MVREEMTETMLETGLEATIGIPIPFVIVVATKNDPCLHEAVHLLCRLVKGLAVRAVPDPEVAPEVRPVAEPERLHVTTCRCQKCRSTFLKVVYLI